jgi:sugar (pentulose or hexulose) kinase
LADILELIETRAGSAQKITVSGGVLRSPASLKMLADALGREVYVSVEPEASLRGAAIHSLEKLKRDVRRPRTGRRIRPNAKLAADHRQRRAKQAQLERALVRGN